MKPVIFFGLQLAVRRPDFPQRSACIEWIRLFPEGLGRRSRGEDEGGDTWPRVGARVEPATLLSLLFLLPDAAEPRAHQGA